MNTLQQNKIEKELSFFQKLDYKLTKQNDYDIRKGRCYSYVLEKNNVQIHCYYTIHLISNRVTGNFNIWDTNTTSYIVEPTKSYKDFTHKYF
jgi:hypothetical protein